MKWGHGPKVGLGFWVAGLATPSTFDLVPHHFQTQNWSTEEQGWSDSTLRLYQQAKKHCTWYLESLEGSKDDSTPPCRDLLHESRVRGPAPVDDSYDKKQYMIHTGRQAQEPVNVELAKDAL